MSQSVSVHEFSSSPQLPDFAALAEKLQETAEALLAISRSSGAHDDSDESEVYPESTADDLKPPFEIRSYEIPDYILHDEQELLKITDADGLLDVLNKIHEHIYCIANLMKHFNHGEDVCDVSLNNIAAVLSLPLDWLDRLSSTLNGFRLVHHMKTE